MRTSWDACWRTDQYFESHPFLTRDAAEYLAESGVALVGIDALNIVEVRRIQGFDVTGLAAIFDCVPHFRGHTQEIVHIARLQLGDAYQFAWTPTMPEQNASA